MESALPQRDPHSTRDIAYHAATAHLYDEVVVEPRRYANDLLFSEIDRAISGGGAMLDVGCGTGHMLERFGPRFDQCVGVDHSEAMLDCAAARIAACGLTQVELINSDVFDFLSNSQDRRFDLISCVGCLHHLQQWRITQFFMLAQNLIKPGGLLLLCEPVTVAAPIPGLIQAWNRHSVMGRRAGLLQEVEAEEADEAPLPEEILTDIPGGGGLTSVNCVRSWELFPRRVPPVWLDRFVMRYLHRRYHGSGNIVATLWRKSDC